MAWRSSRFSRSRALSLLASSLVRPAGALSRSAFFTHSFSVCAVQPILSQSRRSPPIATHARARDPAPSAPHARGPQAKTCSLSCLSSLHLLRSWSLRQTRGGSIRSAPTSDIPARPGYVPMIARSGQVLTAASAGTRPVSSVSPDRDQQLTGEGDDGDTLDAPGGGADAVAIPARQRALGLMTQPQPGELDRAPCARAGCRPC